MQKSRWILGAVVGSWGGVVRLGERKVTIRNVRRLDTSGNESAGEAVCLKSRHLGRVLC